MNLNSYQETAVTCEDSRILCLAGAGTGKTTVLIERILRKIENGADPRSILVLTFTNAAAFEMKERFIKRSTSKSIPEFRTFHSFCYSLLARDKAVRLKLGYSTVPKIADESEHKRVTKEAAMQVNVNLSSDKLNGKKSLTRTEQFQLELVQKATKRLLKAKNLITFDILCYDVCALFENGDECIEKYKANFKYLFVDEFQDTDIRQWRFVKSFENSDIFVCGDALQALYAFRGADSSIIKSLAEDTEWTTIKLPMNYRSGSKIVEFANNMSTYAKDSYRISMLHCREGSSVKVVEYKNDLHRGEIPNQCLLKCEQLARTLTGSVAYLFRTNAEVASLQNYFDSVNISYVSGKQDIDVPNILRSLYNNEFFVSWLSTFLNADSYAEYLRLVFVREQSGEAFGLDEFLSNFGHLKLISERVDTVSQIRTRIKMCDSLDSILKLLSENLHIQINKPEIKLEKYSDLIDYILNNLIDSTYSSTIYIGTIHSSKGLEYENVILCGVDGKSFPLTNEENNNVYYVGITRAKESLYIMKEK